MRQATEAQSHSPVKIALVGKYVQLEDAYLSVVEALRHSGFQQGRGIEIDWVDSETLDDGEVRARLHGADGILIPGGFGVRGIEGKITAARIAREQKIPFLGICLGMQMAVADFARHVVGMDGANSTEFDPETPYPVIDLLPEQKEVADMGGTMRLGADPIKLHANTRAREIYGEAVIYERHRHRYEVNNFLRKRIEAAGLVCSGTSPDERLVEIIEIPDHPFFVASQYHPEFKSRPERPAPLFRDFVAAALERMKEQRPQEIAYRRAGRGPVRAARRSASRAGAAPAAAEEAGQRGREDQAGRALRGALPHPQPFVGGGGVRRARHRRAARDGARGRARRGGQPAGARARAVRADRPAVRAPGHGAAGRADRAGAGRRRLGERERRHPRRRQQVRGGDDPGRRPPLHASRARRSASSCCSRWPRRSACSGPSASTRRSCASEFGYVFDHATPIGELVTASPTLYRVEAEFHGKSAHAGLRPEEGRSAILAAAHAAIAMPHGRIDDQTTANIGYLHGGVESTNVVPERARIFAEVRSVDADTAEDVLAAMIDALHDGASHGECDVDVITEKQVVGYKVKPSSPAVVAAEAALRAHGYEPKRIATGGASDANVLEAAGIPTVNVANGTEHNHEPTERVSVAALDSMLDVAFSLLDEAAVA